MGPVGDFLEPGDSSCDLFNPLVGGHQLPFKGSLFFHHKTVTENCTEIFVGWQKKGQESSSSGNLMVFLFFFSGGGKGR